MKTVQSDELRRHVRDVLDEVGTKREGEHFTILRYQTPAAVIVPRDWYQSVLAILKSAGRGAEWGNTQGAALNLLVNQEGSKVVLGTPARTGQDPFDE